MKTPVNKFKTALYDGQVQYGFWLALADPYCAEICAGAGFDWLLIDGEHAPNDLRSILAQLQTVAPYPVHPIVRPVEGTTAIIKQLLDIGAQTLLVPMVESGEQARELVAAAHYPPEGKRGVATALVRAARWHRRTDYVHRANDEVCMLLQVESARGLENLESILAVDGVDGIFIGPADLAASLGYIGNTGHPDVKKAIDKALDTIRNAGKAAGILATDTALVSHYREQGAVFIAVGVDTLLLANGAASLATRVKQTA